MFFNMEINKSSRQSHHRSRHIKPERYKAFLSVVYMIFSLYCTSFAIAILQAKAPDQRKHPPLPDLFLDNVPEVSWAYKITDSMLILLSAIWIVFGTLHRQRILLIRRTCFLLGTVYLLRCVCILITQLPVPESNVTCNRKIYVDFSSKARRALDIFMAAGTKVTGIRTCGDYMFSGHTVTMTMFTLFISEYTPKRLYYLRVFSWLANVVGMFFILAGHGHYSIDVAIAFLLALFLFRYYHTLANNMDLLCRETRRTKILLPLFYFECNSTGVIPYKYDWPLPTWTPVKNYLRGLSKGKS